MNDLIENIIKKSKESADYIREKIQENSLYKPKLAVLFGTGLDKETMKNVKDIFEIPYEKIPHFSKTIEFHKGSLVFAKLEEKDILLMNGRYHIYEGYDVQDVVYPIHVLKELGIKEVIITSSVGGINENINKGDLMVLKDQINLTSLNPLIGYDNSLGERFLDCSDLYNKNLRDSLKKIASEKSISLKQGNMFFLPGPTFETRAEFDAIKRLGADTIGWSTIPEATVAHYRGMNVLAINCITDSLNNKEKTSLEEITDVANQSSKNLYLLVSELIKDSNNIL